MKLGQMTEGKSLLRRSIDVSHEMALNLIKACHEIGVDCIVAPYEADSQLAYLNLSGIADIIITEDSDLTLFGCKKVNSEPQTIHRVKFSRFNDVDLYLISDILQDGCPG